MPPVIKVEELRQDYQMGDTVVHALRGVSFRVEPGEFVALMGPSGSGKSTLMHLLGCLETATSGTYCLEGRDVSQLSNRERSRVRNRQIGFVFQTFNLLPRLNALQNVLLPLTYRQGEPDAKQQAAAALARVGLAGRLAHRPAQLSGGQRQRVAIARALVTGPDIILADEPTGNLDSQTGEDIMALLDDLNRERVAGAAEHGHTIVVVTHDPQVASMARRTLELRDGEIVGG